MAWSVYLAGAVELVSKGHAQSWRAEAKRLAEEFTGWQPVDPLDWESPDGPWFDNEIVNKDKYLLKQCDAVLMDARSPSWGTAVELAWAHEQGKPVVVWGVTQKKASVFLRYHATIIEPKLADAVLRVAELSLE